MASRRSPQLFFLLGLLCCSSCLALSTASAYAEAANELGMTEAEKNRPVSKVVNLLKDMQKQLEKEGEEDKEIYDKMACWCETNDKEKTKAIKDGKARIEDLQASIDEKTANSAELNTEVKKHEGEVGKNQKALDKATALREQQMDDFNKEEKDMLASIGSMQAATTVLKQKGQAGSSLLQVSSKRRSQVVSALSSAMRQHDELVRNTLTPSQRRVATSFLQESAAPSAEIFGIIDQMMETFKANLKNSQDEEMKNQEAYAELKAAKQKEIGGGQKQLDAKTQQLADTDEKNAQAKQDLADTTNSLEKDEEFLAMVKDKCASMDSEWAERQKTRQLETEAVGKALAVLNGDDARDLFSKNFNPSFVQVEAGTGMQAKATAASQLLTQEALRLASPRLSALASRVKLDAFTKVKKAIDDMMAELQAESASDIKKKDFYTKEFNKNKLEIEDTDRDKVNVLAKIDDLDMSIKTITENIENLKSEIAEMRVQLKRAGEDRENENKDFTATMEDQRATQKLLNKALTVLQGFYGDSASLAQESEAAAPMPGGFKSYKNNALSGGVLGLIKSIIQDSKNTENEALRSETGAQKSYEAFVKDTNSNLKAKGKELVNKSEIKAKLESEHVEAHKRKDSTLKELQQLSETKAELHKVADFLINNFDIRAAARKNEVDALRQAKAILDGSSERS